MVSVRVAEFPRDHDSVSALLGSYLLATETEKAERGLVAAEALLPERYGREIADPATALAGRRILIASLDGKDCGVVVIGRPGDTAEISRFWTSPDSRGRGVGTALLEQALSRAGRPVRLSVWPWRQPAIALYRRYGFETAPSWDARPELVCLELRGARAERRG